MGENIKIYEVFLEHLEKERKRDRMESLNVFEIIILNASSKILGWEVMD